MKSLAQEFEKTRDYQRLLGVTKPAMTRKLWTILRMDLRIVGNDLIEQLYLPLKDNL